MSSSVHECCMAPILALACMYTDSRFFLLQFVTDHGNFPANLNQDFWLNSSYQYSKALVERVNVSFTSLTLFFWLLVHLYKEPSTKIKCF